MQSSSLSFQTQLLHHHHHSYSNSLENHRKIDEHLDNDVTEKELRILDFLQEKGIEFKSPWDKIYDYWENQRKRVSDSKMKEDSNSEKDESTNDSPCHFKGKSFSLNSNLYSKRMNSNKKSCFQSP